MSKTPLEEIPAHASASHRGVTLLDAHVHIHDCFELSQFFDSAARNFAAEARRCGYAGNFDGVLLLTESAGVDRFSELRQSAGSVPTGQWRIDATEEALSLKLSNDDGAHLFVVSGRQIVTAERLEVLALGMADSVDDGLPIRDVIDRVQQSGALCVLPWGFGKWTGKRGRIVRELIGEDFGDNLFLGDNAGRLALAATPGEFQTAARRGIRILPGTDPLPWPDQVGAPARFGCMLDARLPDASPFAHLKRLLVVEKMTPRHYGRLERLLPFVRHQIGMQLRKHVG